MAAMTAMTATTGMTGMTVMTADKQGRQRMYSVKKGTEGTLLPFSQYLYRRMETVDTTTTKLSSWERATPLACQILSASTWVWPVAGLYDSSRPSMSPCMTQSILTGLFPRVNLQPFNVDMQHMTGHLRPKKGDELKKLLHACFWGRPLLVVIHRATAIQWVAKLHAVLKADAINAATRPPGP